MGSQFFRWLGLAAPVVLLMLALQWNGGDESAPVGISHAGDQWVRTKDGWERAEWRLQPHQPPLHPGLVAALMALLSVTILVAGSPRQSKVESPKSKVSGAKSKVQSLARGRSSAFDGAEPLENCGNRIGRSVKGGNRVAE